MWLPGRSGSVRLNSKERARVVRAAPPGHAVLMHEHDAPDHACAALLELEPDFDAVIARLQPQLRFRAGAADSRHANLAASVLAGCCHGLRGESERDQRDDGD